LDTKCVNRHRTMAPYLLPPHRAIRSSQ
jgi:hypothetical protein